MIYAKIENGAIIKYPVNIQQELPNVSFPSNGTVYVPEGYVLVSPIERPIGQWDEKVTETNPILINGEWIQNYVITKVEGPELEQRKESLRSTITSQIQNALDDFARERNYDSLLSACTYATSTNWQFQLEGQCCVELRDAYWEKLYLINADVEAGSRPIPISFDEIKDEFPPLVWSIS